MVDFYRMPELDKSVLEEWRIRTPEGKKLFIAETNECIDTKKEGCYVSFRINVDHTPIYARNANEAYRRAIEKLGTLKFHLYGVKTEEEV